MGKRINTGKVIGGVYIKRVNFSKAVLWMTKELSLRPSILISLRENNIGKLLFVDVKKGESWEFKLPEVIKSGRRKQVGQEEQFYFPIELAKVIKHPPVPVPTPFQIK